MEISKKILEELYLVSGLSSNQIAGQLKCSEGKVNYWLLKHGIKKRSVADAVYRKLNPSGDPFEVQKTLSKEDAFLLGLGLGLFWGEGNKKSPDSVRIGNSDPDLIKAFLYFLRNRFKIHSHRLRFGLQVFTDMDYKAAETFWATHLGVSPSQFYKTVVTVSGKVGTYREKTKFGVLTLYFHNKKLRDLLLKEIDKLKKIDYHADVLP